MKTNLGDAGVTAALCSRLRRITPHTQRTWGKMTAHQMVCHLSDAFRTAFGEKPAKDISNPFSRSVIKAIALRAPMQWPHGIKTVPEVDQELGGTRPVEFEQDVRDVEALIERLVTYSVQPPPGFEWRPHPIFGRLSTYERLRWGYLHVDHHLRQFGR